MDSEEGDIVRALATIIIQRAESTYVSDPRIPCCLIGSRSMLTVRRSYCVPVQCILS